MVMIHLRRPSPHAPHIHSAAPRAPAASANTESCDNHADSARTQVHPPTQAARPRIGGWPIACTMRRARSPPPCQVMTTSSHPYLLTRLSSRQVEDHLTRDRRLLIPVGV